MRYLLIFLFLVGCQSPAERCVEICLKQGLTVDKFEYENRTTAVCRCSEGCLK